MKNFAAAIFREASPYAGGGTKALSAVDLLKQADKKLATALAGRDSERIELSNMIGESLIALGDAAAALQYLQPLVTSSEVAPKWQRERMRAWAQIGRAQLDQGATVPAITSFERALKKFERLEARLTPSRAEALIGLGRAHLAQGEPAQALPLLAQAELFWCGFDAASLSAAAAIEWLARARARSAADRPK